MNKKMEKQFDLLKLYLPIRGQVLDALKDQDLYFQPDNLPSLGEVCVQLGEWQAAYVDGFQSFKQDFSQRNEVPERATSVAKLRDWYQEMDQAIYEAIDVMSEEVIESKGIDRGGWQASVEWNLRIWQECLIIFYTKAYVYFKLMGKDLPEGLSKWIE